MLQRRIAVPMLAARAATLLFLLCYFWVLVITAVDSAFFYAVIPYRRFVLAALLVFVALLPGREWRLKLGLTLIIAVWFSLLPRVSWHEESNFFINAGTLRNGMTVEETRKRMAPFLATTSTDGREVTFQPSPESQDRCKVEVKEGKVRQVHLLRGSL
jgi:hypothetical protein